MAIYCIDDGGDGSQTNTTQSASTLDWSKADTTIANLIAYDAAAFTTSGNIIYFGHDTTEAIGASLTITGPDTGLPVILISADRTQSTPTYLEGTAAQIDCSGGAWAVTFDGAFAIYGLYVRNGTADGAYIQSDSNEAISYVRDGILRLGANRSVSLAQGNVISRGLLENVLIDLTDDGTTSRSATVLSLGNGDVELRGLTFTNPGYRTGVVFANGSGSGQYRVSGCDFSGFATGCELLGSTVSNYFVMSNCLAAASFVPVLTTTVAAPGVTYSFYNVGPADAPVYLYQCHYAGIVASSSSIYRTGGGSVEGEACSWLITTSATCSENAPLYTPFIYGTVSSTGSKTFDLYITNDTADFTDAEAWLEVEYLSTSDEAIWALATDQRATITTTAAAQTDDTTSTWNGTGPSFTYKQKLSVSATVNETGQFRARVAVGKASIAGSAYFYVDPKVTVS